MAKKKQEEPEDTFKMYKTFCERRFAEIEDKVDEVYTTVNDGLKDKVQHVEKQNKWILGLFIGLLITLISATISLHIIGVMQYNKLEVRLQRMEDKSDANNLRNLYND